MNCSPAAESVITFLRPSISQSRLRRFPISYVEPLADHLAAQSAFYVDRAPAEPMTPALPIMPAILKGGQIVDRVLTTRNARLAPRPTLWKECASRVKAGSGHQSVPRIQLSLLLFVDKRRDSSALLVVGDSGHFLSIGRNCDLLDTVNLAIALIGDFDGAVPQLLHRHSLTRIDALHRVLFAIELGFPALAGRCGHAQPIAPALPCAGEP